MRYLLILCLFLLTPAAHGQPIYGDTTSSQAGVLADMQERLSSLERELQRLTGRLEEQSFRMQQLEQRAPTSPQPVQPAAPISPPAPNPLPPVTELPQGTGPDALYNHAFGLLKQAQYPSAEQAFERFLKEYPTHSLAGNAQYWKGETLYVRQQYAAAAKSFLTGYQAYPKNSKAPDNLLKLSLSLAGLGQIQESCQTLSKLQAEYPLAPAPVQSRAAKERSKLSCP